MSEFASQLSMSIIGDSLLFIENLCPHDVKDIIGEKMKEIVQSICLDPFLDLSSTSFLASIFDRQMLRSVEGIVLLFKLEVILKAAIVHYRSKLPEYVFDQLNTVDDLLIDYPSFAADNIDFEEKQKLVIFRNMMKVALNFIPPRNNKRLLLSICATLEGTAKFYSNGGAPSRSTCRRKLIFEQESQLQPNVRRSTSSKNNEADRDPKSEIICECGSAILPRTRWKHRQSIRHCNYLAGLSQSTSSSTCADMTLKLDQT